MKFKRHFYIKDLDREIGAIENVPLSESIGYVGDPHWEKVGLLIQSNDISESTDIIDKSQYKRPLTLNGIENSISRIQNNDEFKLDYGNYSIWGIESKKRIYVGQRHQSHNLHCLTWDVHGKLTLQDTINLPITPDGEHGQPTGGYRSAVWGDENYVYIAIGYFETDVFNNPSEDGHNWGSAIAVFSVSDSGKLAFVEYKFLPEGNQTIRGMWGDEQFIYASGQHGWKINEGATAAGVITIDDFYGPLILIYSKNSDGTLSLVSSTYDMQSDPFWDTGRADGPNPTLAGTVLLIQSDTTDGSVVIVDSSRKNHTIVDNNVNHSTVHSKWGSSSLLFDGDGDYLEIQMATARSNEYPQGRITDFDFDGRDVTIEFWWKHINHSPNGHVAAWGSGFMKEDSLMSKGQVNYNGNGWQFRLMQEDDSMSYWKKGTVLFSLYGDMRPDGDDELGGTGQFGGAHLASDQALDDGEWHHIAVTREAVGGLGHWRMYVDGALQDGASIGPPVSPGEPQLDGVLSLYNTFDTDWDLLIGAGRRYEDGKIGYFGNFYMEDIRITKGRRRFTNTTIGQEATGVEKLFKIRKHPALNAQSLPQEVGEVRSIIEKDGYVSASVGNGWISYELNRETGELTVTDDEPSWSYSYMTTADSKFNYLKVHGTIYAFRTTNGIIHDVAPTSRNPEGSVSLENPITSSYTVVAADKDYVYVAGVTQDHEKHLLFGTGVKTYDARISVYSVDEETGIWTLIASYYTRNLSNGRDYLAPSDLWVGGGFIFASISDNLSSFKFFQSGKSTTEDSQISTALSFDGIDDSITTPKIDFDEFGSDDFTIECWVNSTGNPSAMMQPLISKVKSGSIYHPQGWVLGVLSSTSKGRLLFYDQQTIEEYGVIFLGSKYDILDGQWHHVAVTRKDGLISLWVDGKIESRQSDGATAVVSDSFPPFVGDGQVIQIGELYSSNVYSRNYENFFKGLLDDIRITSHARYDTNFDVSKEPSPTYLQQLSPIKLKFRGGSLSEKETQKFALNPIDYSALKNKVLFGNRGQKNGFMYRDSERSLERGLVDVWGGGKFIYGVAYNTWTEGGFRVYSRNASGKLTLRGSHGGLGQEGRGVWADDGLVLAALGSGGLRSYSISDEGIPTTLETLDTTYARQVFVKKDGNPGSPTYLTRFVFLADHTYLRVYKQIGEGRESLPASSDLINVHNESTWGGSRSSICSGVWADDEWVYSSQTNWGLYIWKVVDAGTLEYYNGHARGDPYSYTYNARHVWSDGNFIYVSYGKDGLYVYKWNPAWGSRGTLELKSRVSVSSYKVWGDGDFIYVVDRKKLHIYTVSSGGNMTLRDSISKDDSSELSVWGDGKFIYTANRLEGADLCKGGLYSYSLVEARGKETQIYPSSNKEGPVHDLNCTWPPVTFGNGHFIEGYRYTEDPLGVRNGHGRTIYDGVGLNRHPYISPCSKTCDHASWLFNSISANVPPYYGSMTQSENMNNPLGDFRHFLSTGDQEAYGIDDQGNYLKISSKESDAYDFANLDFTIEFCVRILPIVTKLEKPGAYNVETGMGKRIILMNGSSWVIGYDWDSLGFFAVAQRDTKESYDQGIGLSSNSRSLSTFYTGTASPPHVLNWERDDSSGMDVRLGGQFYDDNHWHHVAFTRHGNSLSLFVDGFLKDKISIDSSVSYAQDGWNNYGYLYGPSVAQTTKPSNIVYIGKDSGNLVIDEPWFRNVRFTQGSYGGATLVTNVWNSTLSNIPAILGTPFNTSFPLYPSRNWKEGVPNLMGANGTIDETSYHLFGSMDFMRIIKGHAEYTENFLPCPNFDLKVSLPTHWRRVNGLSVKNKNTKIGETAATWKEVVNGYLKVNNVWEIQ
jgi:hypothetical protein